MSKIDKEKLYYHGKDIKLFKKKELILIIKELCAMLTEEKKQHLNDLKNLLNIR